MDTSCLRLRFTPLFKNNCKSDSKCCLEIVPEVSCVQNLDKIQWQHGDDSIEYMIPITYKVILKKKHKKQALKQNDDGQLKTYHSCVDLLVPSDLDVTSSDVMKVNSDSFILKKSMESKDNDVEKMASHPLNSGSHESQAKEHEPKLTSCTGLTSQKKKCYLKEIKDVSTQFIENSYTGNNAHRYQKIYLIDKITSAPFAGDFNNLNNVRSSSVDWDSSIAGKVDRKLSITPICSINTQDNLPIHSKERTSNLIVLRVQETTPYNHNKYIVPNEKTAFKVIKEIDNKSYDTLTNMSSERILPEVRVAQFMKSVEKDLMPLRESLNDMIRKCALLGFICKENQNPMMFNFTPSEGNDLSFSKKESKSNRVVYSMVFDGEMARNEVAERIIDSLAFEVEALPQDNILEVSGTSKSTPLNLKIKVRKKEEALFKQGVVSVPKLGQPKKSPDKIRLVSSDQTVLSFKVFVDTDPERKPAKKRKRFFGGCLSSEDNDDDVYVESNSVDASNSKPGEVVKLNFGLSKNVEDMQLQARKPIMFFGNTCKPGGCLDPPYGEDRYSYGPKVYNDTVPAQNGKELSNAAVTENVCIIEPSDKTSYNDKMQNDMIKTSAPRDVISADTINSPGGISTGVISPGGNNPGGTSNGEMSNGEINNGEISNGDISNGEISNGEIDTVGIRSGVISTGIISMGEFNTGVISAGRISTAQIGKGNSSHKRSILSMDVKPSFRDLSDLSHFSLAKDKKRLTQTENISEVSTSDDEMVITKLYPKENNSNFKSETDSVTQDIKVDEENLTKTILGVGGALTVPLLMAEAVHQVTNSSKDVINAGIEEDLTKPISTIENKNTLRSGNDNDSSDGRLIYPETEEVQNSIEKLDDALHYSKTEEYEYYEDLQPSGEKNKSNQSDEISRNKEPRDIRDSPDIFINDHEARDQKFGSSEDKDIFKSENNTSINNSLDANEHFKLENNVNRKTSNDIKNSISYSDLLQGAKNNETFEKNEVVKDPIENEIMKKNNLETDSDNQPVSKLSIYSIDDKNDISQKLDDLNIKSDSEYIKTSPDTYVIEDQNILQQLESHEHVMLNVHVILSHEPKELNKTSNGVSIINNPDTVDEENEKILNNQQSKSSGVDTRDTNNVDLGKIQDPNRFSNSIENTLSSRAQDNKNLKVDFIDDSTPVMNDDINHLKDKDQATDSILSSRDRSKFQVKKDFINMNLAFQSYTNDQNESVIKSLDNIKDIKREPQDNVTIIKSQLRIDVPNVIKVPIDTRNYMMLEVRASDHQMLSHASPGTPEEDTPKLSDKIATNSLTTSTGSEKSSSIVDVPKDSDNKGKSTSVPSQGSQKNDVESFQNLLSTVYDHQLIPLHLLISDLKTDVDKLASEQLWLKENCRRMRRPTKLTHSSRKCGCSRK